MIRFTCEHCHRAVRVPDRFGGRKGRCPHCREVVAIPPARCGALDDLTAALDPGASAARSADTTAAAVPPPPPMVDQVRLDEELRLPEDDAEDLEDTVILAPEQLEAPTKPWRSERRDRPHPLARPPRPNPWRVVLLVVAVVVVALAAVSAILLLGRLR